MVNVYLERMLRTIFYGYVLSGIGRELFRSYFKIKEFSTSYGIISIDSNSSK